MKLQFGSKINFNGSCIQQLYFRAGAHPIRNTQYSVCITASLNLLLTACYHKSNLALASRSAEIAFPPFWSIIPVLPLQHRLSAAERFKSGIANAAQLTITNAANRRCAGSLLGANCISAHLHPFIQSYRSVSHELGVNCIF